MKKIAAFLRAILSAALIITAPGLAPYEAAAQVVRLSGVRAGLGGNSSAVGAARADGRNSTFRASAPALPGSFTALPSAPSRRNLGASGALGDSVESSVSLAPAFQVSPSLPGAEEARPSISRAGVQAAPALTVPVSEAPAPGARDGSPSGSTAAGAPVRVEKNLDAARAWLNGRREVPLSPLSEKSERLAPAGGDEKRTSTTENEPSSPGAKTPSEGAREKGWLGLGKNAVLFILALITAQIGVEALGAAEPGLVKKAFGDITKMAELTIFASISGIFGRTVGQVAVKKWGLKKTFLYSTGARVLIMSVLAGLLATAHMTWPLMIVLITANGFLGGIAATAESSIPPAIFGPNQAKLERFWTWEQTLLEVVGVTGPILTGAVVSAWGFLPPLLAFPVAFAVSIAIMAVFLRIPAKMDALSRAENGKTEAAGDSGFLAVFKDLGRKIVRGAQVVWRNPILKTAFFAYTSFMLLNPFLYTMLAPNFGVALIGTGDENILTSVIGMLTGLYSLGGLLGGLLMMVEQRKIRKLLAGDEKTGSKGLTPAEEEELMRRSMLKWMKWGTVALVAIATMALPLPMLGALVSLPSWLSWAGPLTLPALMLIPFGVAQVIATVKLKSFFQSKTPEAEMVDAMGFFGSASLAASTVGILALKFLFKGFEGFTPFYIIAGAMIPLAAAYVYFTRRLAKSTAPPSANAASAANAASETK